MAADDAQEGTPSSNIPNIAGGFFCLECGYSLFGIEHSTQCPECGLTIDRSVLGESRLPWSHRHKLGRMRAFFRTAWMGTINSKKIGEEINRPVSLGDALKFRQICVLSGLAPLALVAIVISIIGLQEHEVVAWQLVTGLLICCFSFWLYLMAMTGLPSLFFSPRDVPILRQNRAIALSFYAAAPLVWTFIPVAVCSLIPLLYAIAPEWDRNGFWFYGVVSAAYGIALLWVLLLVSKPFSLLKHSLYCGSLRRLAVGAIVPISWVILFYVIAVGIPAVAFWLAVVVQSLL
jgi:hypothetical protein